MRVLTTILLVVHLFAVVGFAQSVTIGPDTASAHPSAILDVQSTDKGLLVPRMSTAKRNSITSPAMGLLVFDETTVSFWLSDDTDWIELKTGNLTQLNDSADDRAVGVSSRNTAIGAFALRGSTPASANTGIDNVAIGSSSL